MKLKQAIIIDLDGTLCNVDHRLHFISRDQNEQKAKDWQSFHAGCKQDSLNKWCHEIYKKFKNDGYSIILITGRLDSYLEVTKDWLNNQNIEYDHLFMRPTQTKVSDAKFKKDVYQNELASKYQILFVLEDRASVVEMWRDLGLICLQCDKGDF